MTDSPRLEEVFGRVIAEHQTYGMGPFLCSCGWKAPRETPRPSIIEHQAERLAARLLAHRDPTLEALGGEEIDVGDGSTRGAFLVWRFPVSEEAQK